MSGPLQAVLKQAEGIDLLLFGNTSKNAKICRQKGTVTDMISTRGRYGLRVMLDLAQYQGDGFVPMKDVADRQNLSLKYLEQILPALKKNKLVKGVQGKGGGYRLTREPKDYVIGDILRITEKELAPVGCLAEGAEECALRSQCKTIGFWEGLNDVINDYLNSKTLADLM